MNRRKVLTGAAGIGAASIGLAAFSGGAAATLEEYEFASNTISATTDDGQIAGVTAQAVDVQFGFTGLEDNAEFAVVLLSAGDESDSILDYAVVSEEVSDTTANGIDVGTTLGGDLTQLTDYEVSDFEVDNDGGDTTVDVMPRLDAIVFSNTDDAVDAGTIEDYIDAGDDLQSGLDQLENNTQYYDYVQTTKTATLHVEMSNRASATAPGAQAAGEIVTGD